MQFQYQETFEPVSTAPNAPFCSFLSHDVVEIVFTQNDGVQLFSILVVVTPPPPQTGNYFPYVYPDQIDDPLVY